MLRWANNSEPPSVERLTTGPSCFSAYTVRFAPVLSPHDGHVLAEKFQRCVHLTQDSCRCPRESASSAAARMLSCGGPPQRGQLLPPRGDGSAAHAAPAPSCRASSGACKHARARNRSLGESSCPASHPA